MKKDINDQDLKKEEQGNGEGEYKKGGSIKKCDKRLKFAQGGIGKFRHDQSTLSGKQIPKKKNPVKNTY